MVRSRLREGQADDTPVRKGSKESARAKKRRPVVGGSLGSDDEEDAFGCEEDEEGLEGLGVPLDSVVKVSMLNGFGHVLDILPAVFQFSLCLQVQPTAVFEWPRFGAFTAPPTSPCHGSGEGNTGPAAQVS